ncbi:MAG TPA: PhnD/SsuA/transferrin family substrate-binding protein [Gemmataceae bacterium]|jgi:ABC-type phosphate/phosphonate transport system substrate-binding protein|nr:PhnD/SsuA/transferrin family substrate-binding protein [Gemmataceae bacterium]
MFARFVRCSGFTFGLGLGCLLVSLSWLPAQESPSAPAPPGPVKIGLPANLFRDIPRPTAEALLPTFGKLMEGQTGMKGQPMLLNNSHEVAQQLVDGKVQLGVFHGFEFAWAQSQHPELKPLVIAISQNNPYLNAQIVVPADSSFNKLEDLKDQQFAIPKGTREHCRLYVFRNCRLLGHKQDKFFGNISNPPHVTAALDAVADGKVQGTVVDGTALENYRWLNPGKSGKLRTLMKSETFPTGVIVYREGGMPEADLQKFKSGLVTAHQTTNGLQLMMLWKMSRFEVVPADYHQLLSNIVKAYPPPAGEEP